MIDATFPLIDLHRHLDGSVRLATIIDLGREHNLPLPAWDIESLRPFVQVTQPQPGVMAFIKKFEWMVGILVDENACYRIAYESVEDAKKEGLDYVELRFSPAFMAEPYDLSPEVVIEAVIAGVLSASTDNSIPVGLIGILSRTYGADIAQKELDALLVYRNYLVAIDLAGDEANYPGELFVDHMKRVREAGLQVIAHAGESAGPQSIWQAIRELGAVRIGHAVHAVDDPALLDDMQMNGIGIESNLTSNVQTSTVRDYASHPIIRFLEQGILTNLNTDDPGISAIDIQYEYNVAAPLAGLSEKQIFQLQHNALEMSFLVTEEKRKLVRQKSLSQKY
jgi:adenosine deaminase